MGRLLQATGRLGSLPKGGTFFLFQPPEKNSLTQPCVTSQLTSWLLMDTYMTEASGHYSVAEKPPWPNDIVVQGSASLW